MASFRDIKKKARGLLHRGMQQAVVYVEDPTNPKSATRVVSARVHHLFDQMGGLKGTSFHTTEREEVKPKAIFLVEEVPKPMRNAVISVDLGEAYRLDHSMPPDGITVTAPMLKLDLRESNLMPLRAVHARTSVSTIVRVDYCTSPNRILYSVVDVPAILVGDVFTLRAGLAYQVSVIVNPTTVQVIRLDETYGMPTP